VGSAVQSSDLPEITREELIAGLRSSGLTLVDVLPPESFAARHLPRAINLSLADIPSRAPQILEHRDTPLVVYCGGPT
jgi:rhodanese-related sulfurtransferase